MLQDDEPAALKVPAPQAVQDDAPAALKVPTPQLLQIVALAALKVPAVHDKHAALDVLPVLGLYLPAAQLTHDDAPPVL